MKNEVFTKNSERPQFDKRVELFVGEDKYISSKTPEGRVLEEK